MAMLSHRQGCSEAVTFAVFSFVFLIFPEARAQTVYQSHSSEVRIAFFATDENDHLVEHLSADDFAIVDSGNVIRNFRSLTRANETSFHVMVLVDASGSVAQRSRLVSCPGNS